MKTPIPLSSRGETRAERKEREEETRVLLGYASQCRGLGFSAVNLLNEAITAERDVQHFERRKGKLPEWNEYAKLSRSNQWNPDVLQAMSRLVLVLRSVPNALNCWRVRYSLQWLRAPRLLHAEKDVPKHLRDLLLRAGEAIADPHKLSRPDAPKARVRRAEQLQKILHTVRTARTDKLTKVQKDESAKGAGFSNWQSLLRRVRTLKSQLESPDGEG